jgi:hypothetical protein
VSLTLHCRKYGLRQYFRRFSCVVYRDRARAHTFLINDRFVVHIFRADANMLSQILEAWNSNARGPHIFLVTALGCAGIALLRWLYITLTQEKRPRLWAGVAPGWKGYRQGQIKYIFQGGDVLIDGIRKVSLLPFSFPDYFAWLARQLCYLIQYPQP